MGYARLPEDGHIGGDGRAMGLPARGKGQGGPDFPGMAEVLDGIDLGGPQAEAAYGSLAALSIEAAGEERADPEALADGLPAGDPVRAYLKEIGSVPLLGPDGETRLARRVSTGNLARELLDGPIAEDPDPASLAELERFVKAGGKAGQEMAEANLRLVVSVAKHYAGRGIPLLDLVQEGNLGLLKAVGRFDYRRGCRFATYAVWWIRQAVVRAIENQGRLIRLPVHVAAAAKEVARASRELSQELGRDPSPEEVAGRTGMPADKVREVTEAVREPVSLEAPVGDDGGCLGDLVPDAGAGGPGKVVESAALREGMEDVLGTLSPKEEKVLRLRFGFVDGRTRTLEEVGREFGVTRERIRQIEAKALRKLRHPGRRRKLECFLD